MMDRNAQVLRVGEGLQMSDGPIPWPQNRPNHLYGVQQPTSTTKL